MRCRTFANITQRSLVQHSSSLAQLSLAPTVQKYGTSASAIPEQVLFATEASTLWFYRLLGYNALALTSGSIYFAPQLLFEHEWAPFGMRLVRFSVEILLDCV